MKKQEKRISDRHSLVFSFPRRPRQITRQGRARCGRESERTPASYAGITTGTRRVRFAASAGEALAPSTTSPTGTRTRARHPLSLPRALCSFFAPLRHTDMFFVSCFSNLLCFLFFTTHRASRHTVLSLASSTSRQLKICLPRPPPNQHINARQRSRGFAAWSTPRPYRLAPAAPAFRGEGSQRLPVGDLTGLSLPWHVRPFGRGRRRKGTEGVGRRGGVRY